MKTAALPEKLAILCMPLALLAACGKSAPPAEPAPTVKVAAPLLRDVTDWDDYAGRFEAVDSVEVRPRVSGLLQSVHFRDGQDVKKGQLLFVIDPRPFAAQLSQSKAQLARAQGGPGECRGIVQARQLAHRHPRHQPVGSRDASPQPSCRPRQTWQAAEASVEANALNLEFTRVVAPIDGHISSHRLAAGNLVAAGTTLLTTIVTLDPIRFVFDAPESALLKYKREQSGIERRQRRGHPAAGREGLSLEGQHRVRRQRAR